MLYALDTNILAYAEGVNGEARSLEARAILRSLPRGDGHVPVQALGELFVVLLRRAQRAPDAARRAVADWAAAYAMIETTPDVLQAAMDLAATHRLPFWDSVMLAAASDAGCDLLLTEDLQDGFAWRGVTVRNPFRTA